MNQYMQHRKSVLALLAAVALGATALAGCSSSPPPEDTPSGATSDGAAGLVPQEYRDGGVTVALLAGSLPLSDVSEDQKGFQGVNYDLLQALSENLGVEFTYEATSFENMIPGAQNGRYDIAAAAFYDTEEREGVVDMVTYFTDGAVFVTTAGGPEDLTEDSLCGLSIAVIQGGAQAARLPAESEACVAAGEGAIDLQVFPNAPSGVLALLSGRVDAFDLSTSVGLYVVSQNDELIAGEPFKVVPVGLVLPQGSDLADAMVAGIDELIESGEYGEILDTWGLGVAGIEASELNPMTAG